MKGILLTASIPAAGQPKRNNIIGPPKLLSIKQTPNGDKITLDLKVEIPAKSFDGDPLPDDPPNQRLIFIETDGSDIKPSGGINIDAFGDFKSKVFDIIFTISKAAGKIGGGAG